MDFSKLKGGKIKKFSYITFLNKGYVIKGFLTNGKEIINNGFIIKNYPKKIIKGVLK